MTNNALQLSREIRLNQLRREAVKIINDATNGIGIIAQTLRELAQRCQSLLQMSTLVDKHCIYVACNAIDILHDARQRGCIICQKCIHAIECLGKAIHYACNLLVEKIQFRCCHLKEVGADIRSYLTILGNILR